MSLVQKSLQEVREAMQKGEEKNEPYRQLTVHLGGRIEAIESHLERVGLWIEKLCCIDLEQGCQFPGITSPCFYTLPTSSIPSSCCHRLSESQRPIRAYRKRASPPDCCPRQLFFKFNIQQICVRRWTIFD